jgi:hypothetical protein
MHRSAADGIMQNTCSAPNDYCIDAQGRSSQGEGGAASFTRLSGAWVEEIGGMSCLPFILACVDLH